MNRSYRTLWNCHRQQVVVVSDVGGSAQSHGASTHHGTATVTAPAPAFGVRLKHTLLASVLAGLLVSPAFAAPDAVYDMDWDASGETTHNNVTVEKDVTLTNDNKYCVGGVCMDVTSKYVVQGTLTNNGTIVGEGGAWEVKNAVNAAGASFEASEVKLTSGSSTTAFQNEKGATVDVSTITGTGKVENAGTMTLDTLDTTGDVTNTGSLSVTNDVSVDAGETYSNSGTKFDLANVRVQGTLTNTAASGAVFDSLDVQGTVNGTGNLTVNGTTTIAAQKSLTQNTLSAKGNVTNSGTLQLEELNLTDADFANQGTANVGQLTGSGNVANNAGSLTTTGMTIASGKTFSNAEGAAAALGGTTTVAGTFTNEGTLTGHDVQIKSATNTNSGSIDLDGTLTVSGKLTNTGSKLDAETIAVGGSLVNNANGSASALNLSGSGAVSGTGSMSVTGQTTLADGTALSQASLTTDALDSTGTLTITEKLTASTADFKTGATGTVANASMKGALTHAGTMTFNALDSNSQINNTDGTLTIDSLTGTSAVTNASGATLDLDAGTATMASLSNSGTARIGNATVTGAVQNTSGTLTAASGSTLTAGSLANSAEANLVNATISGAVTSSNKLDVSGKLTAQNTVDFQEGATGTIAEADVTGNVSNAGNVTVSALNNSAEIHNTAGSLTITNLTGEAALTNDANATLASTGTLALASLSSAGTANLGAVTATGAVTNTGTMTATGKVAADAFTQNSAKNAALAALDVETLTVTQGTLSSTGKIEATTATNNATVSTVDLTVTESFANNSTLTSTGTADLTAYSQDADATGTFATATLKGSGTLNGTVTADNLTIAADGAYAGAANLSAETLNVSGDLKLTGEVNSDTVATIASGKTLAGSKITLNEATLNGTLEGGAEGTTVANLTTSEGAVLKTTGTMTFTNVAEGSLTGVTYEQSGNGSIVVTDDSWFTGSTVNLFGGSLDRTGKTLGTGNVYNVKREGAGDIVDLASVSAQNTIGSDWMANRTVLTVDTLTSDNTVNLFEGGVLDVDTITLTAGEKTLNLEGGAVSTTLDQFFEGIKTDALDMEAVDEETGRIEIKGSVIGLTSVGDIHQSIKDHVGFGSGDIVFNDAAITVDLVAEVNQKIAEQAGVASDDISVHYTGKTDQVFTTDVANKVIDNNSGVRAIFDNSTLYSRTDADETGKELVVGVASEEGKVTIKDSIGFANVALTEKVTVKGGKEFALIGEENDDFSSLVGTSGTVDVTGEGSKFTLGTLGRKNMTGSLAAVNVTDNGTLFAKGGNYKVTTVTATGGKVETGAANTLATETLTLDGTSTLTNAGAFSVTNFTDAAGTTSENTGVLNVANATTLKGSLKNSASGVAVFQNRLTVADGAKVENASTGRNSGMSVAGLTVSGKDGFSNTGTLISTADNFIQGAGATNTEASFTNGASGVVDFTAGKTTIGVSMSETDVLDAGDQKVYVHNSGTMNFGDLDLAKGAELINFKETNGQAQGANGQITAENLTMDAVSAITNWGTINVTGTMTSNGTICNVGTLGTTAANVDSLTNDGNSGLLVRERLDVVEYLTNAEGALIDASNASATFGENSNFENAGTVLVKTLTLDEGASFTNSGDVSGDALVVADKAEVTNEKSMSFTSADIRGHYQNRSGGGDVSFSESMTIAGDGFFENMGEALVAKSVTLEGNGKLHQLGIAGGFTAADTLTMKDNAEVLQTAGRFVVSKGLDFQSGTLSFQGELSGDETPVEGSIMLTDTIGGALTIENAKVTVGHYTEEGSIETLGFSATMPEAKHVLIGADAPLELGTHGKLYVGEGARANVASLGDGDAFFGTDSLFVIDTTKMTSGKDGAAALVGYGDLSVADDAKLHVVNAGWGSYYVTKGFDNETLGTNAWSDANLSWTLDGDKHFELSQDEDGNVILTVGDGSGSLPDELDGIAIPNIVDETIYDASTWDPDRVDEIGFIRRATEDAYLDESLMVPTINETSEIAAMGGVLNQGLTMASNVADVTDRHLSFEDVHFKNGTVRAWDGVRLWADALGQKVDRKLDFTFGKADFDGENYGFIIGGDLMTDSGLRYGVAFAAQKGSVDSNGAAVQTSNDADAYSVTGYAAKAFNKLNVIGSIAYTRVESDVEQTLPGSMHLGKHTLDQTDDILSVGIKAEYRIPMSETIAFVPYAGLRNVTVFSSNESSTMGGTEAFRYDTDTVNQWQLPIGVALQGAFETAGGWTTTGTVDLTVTPVLGDKEADTQIHANELDSLDKVHTTLSDDVTGALRLGVMTEKDNFAFGADLGYVGSGDTEAVTFGLKARYAF